MKKLLLLSSIFAFSLLPMVDYIAEENLIENKTEYTPQFDKQLWQEQNSKQQSLQDLLQNLKQDQAVILQYENAFHIYYQGQIHTIQNHNLDPLLRVLKNKDMSSWIDSVYIRIAQLDNGEIVLHSHVRGLGGGLVGASLGAMAGGAVVQGAYGVATYGVGIAATAVAGPAVAAGVVAVWGWFTIFPVTVATKTAMIAGGIAGGVATGPV